MLTDLHAYDNCVARTPTIKIDRSGPAASICISPVITVGDSEGDSAIGSEQNSASVISGECNLDSCQGKSEVVTLPKGAYTKIVI